MNSDLKNGERYSEDKAWILDVIVSVLLAIFSVYKFSFIPVEYMRILRIASVALLLLMHCTALKRLPNLIAVIQFGVVIVVSTIVANGGADNVRYAVLQGLTILAFFTTFYDLKVKYGIDELLRVLFAVLLIICFLNDATVIMASVNASDSVYLIGNKFTTGDLHIFVLAIYAAFLTKKHGYVHCNWGIYLAFVVWSVFILVKAQAMTALLGFLLSALITVLLNKKIKGYLLNGWVYVAILAVGNLVYFGTGFLLQSDIVQYFVSNVLGRSLTMTGRTPIYDCLEMIISEKPIFGWGYGTDIVERVVGYGNAQNGVADLAVHYGVIGVVSFGLLLVSVLKSTTDRSPCVFAFTGMLYAAILTSMAEITFGLSFFFRLAFLAVMLSSANHEKWC